MTDQTPPPGFAPAATAFFAGLEADNSRDYWQRHRLTFEASVRAPMAALLESLPKRYQPFHVFRMNRDVRFSPDKSPYKLTHGAVHGERGSVHYLHLDADGLLVACGAYVLSPGQLERYRRAVAEDRPGRALERLLRRIADGGLEVGAGGTAPLKTAPRGYPRDHPRIELLRQKGVIASQLLGAADLGEGEQVRQFVLDTYAAAESLHRWLGQHVGEEE